MQAFQQRKKFGSHAGRIAGSLIAFLFTLRGLHFREAVFRGEIVRVIFPDLKQADRNVAYRKGAVVLVQKQSNSPA